MAEESRTSPRYICLKCRRTFDESQIKILGYMRCPYCGYKIILKVRSGTPKRLKAI